MSSVTSAPRSVTRLDHAVVCGRFAPPLADELALVRSALRHADRVIVVADGDRQARTLRHPFTVAERAAMLEAALGPRDAARVLVRGVREFLYAESRWIAAVQATVAEATGAAGTPARRRQRIGIVVSRRRRTPAGDDARFPQWHALALDGTPPDARRATRSAVHDLFFGATGPLTRTARTKLADRVPEGALAWLVAFRGTPGFARLAADHEHIRGYRAKFAMLEFPPVFTTVDAVLVHSGHLLLIERGGDHGAGLWALPGGFLDQNERIVDACVRELREETRLPLDDAALRGALRATAVFDAPERSLRGRTITHAFHFEIAAGPLPAIRGADDAKRARWVPLAEVRTMEPRMFDDHFQVIEHFLGA
jgi:bifunctional NMN adenylyltransferase/nudix hydrolase